MKTKEIHPLDKSCKMWRTPNLQGKRFGKLTVIEIAGWMREKHSRCIMWKCKCDCGNIIYVPTHSLNSGNTTSCGCKKIEFIARRSRTHGMTKTRTYASWYAMKRRCSEKSKKHKKDYYDRGIKVCERWEKSFENFLSDMGVRPEGMTLDRIDVNGNYEPSNCRWADATTQANNARSNYAIIYNGVKGGTLYWSEKTGIPASIIRCRIRAGWDVSDILNVKLGEKRKKK